VESDERLEEIAREIDRLAERLTDVAMDLLRSAARGEDQASVETATAREKQLNRARAALEKAAHLVRLTAGAENYGW
jgi:hypothetical protein